MSNNLAGLNAFLDTALNDADVTWTSAEKDNILTWAVASLYPRLARQLDPTTTTVTLVEDTYFYSLPSGVMDVSQVFVVDSNDEEWGFLTDGTWEIVGDPILGTGLIHVSPTIVNNVGGELRLYGYGRFDTSSNLIPDDYVPIVLATARAEAYRRVAGDRARFKVWLARQQTQNISENEALQMVSDAARDADQLKSQFKTWRRPVPGRV